MRGVSNKHCYWLFSFSLRQFRLTKLRFFVHSTMCNAPYIHPRLDLILQLCWAFPIVSTLFVFPSLPHRHFTWTCSHFAPFLPLMTIFCCSIICLCTLITCIAKIMDPDHTVPLGVVWSRFTVFAPPLKISCAFENMQQTDYRRKCIGQIY